MEHETNGRPQRGRGAKTQALLEEAIAIIAAYQPITVRGVCYKLFVRGLLSGMVVSETQKVSRLLVYGREQGLIPWDSIVDESREMDTPLRFNNLEDFAATVQHAYRKDFWGSQPYCLQVWSEKSTVGGLLRPITQRYGVSFMVVHGFGSATVVRKAAKQSTRDDRKLVMLYCGDHDPSGTYMSDVDLPARMEQYGGKLTIHRIALWTEDCTDLPAFPAKQSDPRYKWYRKNYGENAWELDAMDPNVLRDRVESEIQSYINPDAWQRMQLVEAAEQKTVREVAAALTRGAA